MRCCEVAAPRQVWAGGDSQTRCATVRSGAYGQTHGLLRKSGKSGGVVIDHPVQRLGIAAGTLRHQRLHALLEALGQRAFDEDFLASELADDLEPPARGRCGDPLLDLVDGAKQGDRAAAGGTGGQITDPEPAGARPRPRRRRPEGPGETRGNPGGARGVPKAGRGAPNPAWPRALTPPRASTSSPASSRASVTSPGPKICVSMPDSQRGSGIVAPSSARR